MKAKNIIFGILIILFGIFGILEVSGVITLSSGISYIQIIGGLILAGFAVTSLIKGRICTVLYSLMLIFMIFERNIAVLLELNNQNIINNWLLLLFTTIICIGIHFLKPRRVRVKKARVSGYNVSHDDGASYKEHSFGAAAEYIDCATFTRKHYENNLGQTVIRFENVSEYIGEGIVCVENNLGHMEIYVPSDWRVTVNIENSLGAIRNDCGNSATGPVLYIEGENNLGAIDIVRA